MCVYMNRFDKELYEEWLAGVDEACSFNLDQPLITRNEETKLISVNFDQQVMFPPPSIHDSLPPSLSLVGKYKCNLAKILKNM